MERTKIGRKTVVPVQVRDRLIVVRVTRLEHGRITEAAKQEQRSVSDYLRRLGVRASRL